MPSVSWLSRSLLYLRVVTELLRYDLAQAIFGFRGVHRSLRNDTPHRRSTSAEMEAVVCETVSRILPFYWKPVQCLQQSVVTARVLRAYGAQAEVVIGCRLAPFLGHAWVEVGGRVVNDSPAFQRRLQSLARF